MTEFMSLLRESVREQSRTHEVAILLSAGLDSLSVGLALQAEGKQIHAYTFEVQGYESSERRRVESIARHYGWPLTVVTIPTINLRNDFIELAVRHACRKKVHFEVLWPLLYVLPSIREHEIWTGWNADDNYGNTREIMMKLRGRRKDGLPAEMLKREFDEYRMNLRRDFVAEDSNDTWWFGRRLASHFGKVLLDAYTSDHIFEYFLRFDHEQLSAPNKPIVRQALAREMGDLDQKQLKAGVRLQKGSQVHVLFETLLDDPVINRFCATGMPSLYRKWAKEMSESPEAFTAEAADLPARPAALKRVAKPPSYTPYTMADVRKSSDRRLFTCVSAFAGGGGSSIGYRLAGGITVGAIEFVPEAARTYRRNFRDTTVDERDIRQVLEEDPDELLRRFGLQVGDLDILDGSPPCSEFSAAGTGIKDQSIMRPYSDVKQAGIATLPFDFARLVRALKPRIVVCENVPPLATRYGDVLAGIIRQMCFDPDGRRQYYASHSVLAADDFGVPQSRRRLFILGIRADVADAVGVASDDAVRRIVPFATSAPVTIRDALQNLKQDFRELEPWRRSAAAASIGETIRRFPKNPKKHLRLSDIEPENHSQFTLRRCSWDLPAPTLVVSGQRPDGMTGSFHPEFDRKFTIPELKRLFGLPDDFSVTGTVAQASERICRMVPPYLTCSIARSVYEQVLKPYHEVIK